MALYYIYSFTDIFHYCGIHNSSFTKKNNRITDFHKKLLARFFTDITIFYHNDDIDILSSGHSFIDI